MSTIEEIQRAIESLPRNDYMRLISWVHAKDWKEWDRQIELDEASGKLDFLLDEAMAAKKDKTLRDI